MKKKLPDFSKMTDDEIADFWDTNDSADYWDQMEEVKEEYVDKHVMKPISIRIDERTLEKLKKTASEKGIGYQTLIKIWINERLEKEAS